MRKLVLFLFSCLVLLAVLSSHRAARPADEQGQGAVSIRAQSSEVLVDAIVTDKRNRLVMNLKPEDFVVYEDGVPQTIASFRIYRPESGAPVAAAPKPAETAAPAPAPPPRPEPAPAPATVMPNLTVVLLDYSTTEFQNQRLVREAAVKYVQERLRPNDFMAVFVLGSSLTFLTDFTNDKERLVAALSRRDAAGSAYAGERGAMNSTIAGARSVMPSEAPAPSVASGTPGAAGAGAALSAYGSQQASVMAAGRIEAQYVALRSAMDRRQSRNVLTAIRAIALGVRHIEGRKSLVLFSQGFVVGEAIEEELHAVVDAANRSRLAIYSIDAKGLEARELSGALVPRDELSAAVQGTQRQRMQAVGGETVFDRALEAGRDVQESPLRYIAYATGGDLIRNTNDLLVGLNRVDDEEHSYYLLSYRPRNAAYNGKFRQIRVEVKQAGLTVRARSGYYAIPAGYELLMPAEFASLEGARATPEPARLPLFVRAGGFRVADGSYRVPIVLDIPTRALKFEKIGAGNLAKVEITGIAQDSLGNAVARFGGQAQFNATDAEYQALLPGSISLLDGVVLPPGTYRFEVAVKDPRSGAAGFSEGGVVLHATSPEFALSTVLLARDVDKAPAGAAGRFLTAQGVKILPSALCRFRNGENLIYYFDIYNPGMRTDKKADLKVNVWLTRDGRRVNVRLPQYALNAPADGQPPRLTVARYVQLAGLRPGDYALVVEVKDGVANRAERTQAAFTVAN